MNIFTVVRVNQRKINNSVIIALNATTEHRKSKIKSK